MTEVLLAVRAVSKRFGGVQALDAVSLAVRRGEIVALLGHNGSGKSTLVKILSGAHLPDSGEIVRGETGATRLHFIHQSLGLVPALSVAENFDLARPAPLSGLAPLRRAEERARIVRLMQAFGVSIDPDAEVGALSTAQRTVVAIVRALDGWEGGEHVLVLDEPTAALHGEEVETLKRTVRAVAAAGAGVVYISHRLGEVTELADRAIVLRNGRVVAERVRGGFGETDLVQIIAGAALDTRSGGDPAGAGSAGRPLLALRDVTGSTIRPFDLDVGAGEIVGIAGLVGSGMEALNALLFGAEVGRTGSVRVDGRPVPPGRPADAIAAGVAYVPADRHRLAAFGPFSARENVTLPRFDGLRDRSGRIDRRRERDEVLGWMERLRVHPAGLAEQPFQLFSGGNQQKLVLARWLRMNPKVLLVDEPTQGIDAGAQAEIYGLLADVARRGAAVMVSSSDAKELAGICHRVVVFVDGVAASHLAGPALSEHGLIAASLNGAAAAQAVDPSGA